MRFFTLSLVVLAFWVLFAPSEAAVQKLPVLSSSSLPGGSGAAAIINFAPFGFDSYPVVIIDQETATGSARFSIANLTKKGELVLPTTSFSTPTGSCPLNPDSFQYGVANVTIWITCWHNEQIEGTLQYSLIQAVFEESVVLFVRNLTTAQIPPVRSLIWNMLTSGGTRLYAASEAWGTWPAAVWMVQAYPMMVDSWTPLPSNTAAVGGVASNRAGSGATEIAVVVTLTDAGAASVTKSVLALFDAQDLHATGVVTYAINGGAGSIVSSSCFDCPYVVLVTKGTGLQMLGLTSAGDKTIGPVSICNQCSWAQTLGVSSFSTMAAFLLDPPMAISINLTTVEVLGIASFPDKGETQFQLSSSSLPEFAIPNILPALLVAGTGTDGTTQSSELWVVGTSPVPA